MRNSFVESAVDKQIKIEVLVEAINPNYTIYIKYLKEGIWFLLLFFWILYNFYYSIIAYVQVFVLIAGVHDTEEILKEAYNQGILGKDYVWIAGDTMYSINAS